MSMLIYDTLIKSDDKVFVAKQAIVEYLTENVEGKNNGFYYFAWSSIFKGKKIIL